MSLLSDNGYNYIFGITPEDINDKECCYFNIWIEKRIINETTETVVFYAKSYGGFKVRNKFQKPTTELFFEWRGGSRPINGISLLNFSFDKRITPCYRINNELL